MREVPALGPHTIAELLREEESGPLARVFLSSFSHLFVERHACSACGASYTRAGNLGGACPTTNNPPENHNGERNGDLFVPSALLGIIRAAGSRLEGGTPHSIVPKTHGLAVRGLVFRDGGGSSSGSSSGAAG